MDPLEKQAAEFLAGVLAGQNYVEFHREAGKLLNEYKDGLLTPTEALWQLRRLHDEVKTANRLLEAGQQPPA